MPAELIVRHNPARVYEPVGSVPVADGAEVDRAVAAAEAGVRSWAGKSAEERARSLLPAAAALDGVAAEAARLLARESGKPLTDCQGEIRFSAAVLRWYAEHAPGLLADRVTDDAAGRLTVRHRPFGAVAALTPWNAPVVLTLVKLAPALAAGNALVVKPSPLAPLAVSLVLDTLARHVPSGLVHVVHGYAETARALAGHARIRKVSFTGGPEAGRAVGAIAAATLTPTTMELGGNDAAVLLDDARLSDTDLERLVLASFATAGQVCMAAKRIYVPRRRYERFVAEYVAAAHRALLLGDPLRPGTTVGPVISAEAADRMRRLVADTRNRGGSSIELGRACPDTDLTAGHFVRPALLLGLDDSAPAVREEQFGPVVPVLPYDEEDEVAARVNATEYGLGASVWSADEDRAFAFARRFEAGFCFVNTHNRTGMSLRAPFGGVKRSGHGREYGPEGLYAYTQPCATHAPAAFRPGGAGMPPGAYPDPT